ncbi:acetyltransferase [Thermovorax subterraneus]|nr:acetyltransferase [Thermovorax subterraneus]
MTVSEPIVVIGAGGHAKVVAATLIEAGFKVAFFLDEDEKKWGGKIFDIPIVGPGELVKKKCKKLKSVVAIGDNLLREKVVNKYSGYFDWMSVIHPRAYVHPSVRIGEGTVVFAGAIIQPDTVIGEHVIINTGATIDHDCVVGDFVHIAPGTNLAGGVTVEKGAFLGIGTKVIPGVKIGMWSKIGAGSVVIKDIESNVTAVGVPAKVIKKLN